MTWGYGEWLGRNRESKKRQNQNRVGGDAQGKDLVIWVTRISLDIQVKCIQLDLSLYIELFYTEYDAWFVCLSLTKVGIKQPK